MTDPIPPVPPVAPVAPTPPAAPAPDLGDRMKSLGDELGARGQQLGREAQAAGDRWARDPGVVRAADTATRFWGLLLLLAGLWFAAEITFGYDLPAVAWGAVWPVILIALGLVVILRGMSRRS